MTECESCGGDTGSDRASYCSRACRQRAYRQRTRDQAAAGHGPPPPVWGPLDLFVGRAYETKELRAQVRVNRMVTVTGPAGVGKTRLVGEVVLRGAEQHRAYLVELGAMRDVRRIAEVFSTALGLTETPGVSTVDAVVERLRAAGPVVVVVDNCEHLMPECAAFVQRLLDLCPNLRVLATSREELGLQGERVLLLDPLAVPEPDTVSSDQLSLLDAVRLFLARAREVAPGFGAEEKELRVVARICHRLDGIPLAIELAARQAHALSVHEIHRLLDDRLRPLTQDMRGVPDRHLSLRTTIEWSYRLLSPVEQATLRRVAICPGAFDLGLATAVCAGDPVDAGAVPALVRSLAAKSLVQRHRSDGWFRLLRPVRWYAVEQLATAFEVERTKTRGVAWAVRLTDPVASSLMPGAELTDLIDAHRDNLLVALNHVQNHGGQACDRALLTVALARAWRLRGRTEAALRLLEKLFDEVPSTPHHPAALVLYASLLNQRGDALGALVVITDAAALARAEGQHPVLARALRTVASVLDELGHKALAEYYYERAVEQTRAWGGPLETAICQQFLAWSLLPDQIERARELVDAGMPAFRASGTADTLAIALQTSAAVHFVAGDLDAAHRDLRAAVPSDLRLASRLQRYLWPYLLEGFAVMAWHAGDLERAATLLTAAQPHREGSEPRLTRVWHEIVQHVRVEIETTLPPRVLFDARRRAAGLSDAELLVLVRGEETRDVSVLTEQELRVVSMLAEGNTSAQIARRMSASVRTVATHVGRIRQKLALDSRGQIIHWYLRQQG